jgi:hypothetical protein
MGGPMEGAYRLAKKKGVAASIPKIRSGTEADRWKSTSEGRTAYNALSEKDKGFLGSIQYGKKKDKETLG